MRRREFSQWTVSSLRPLSPFSHFSPFSAAFASDMTPKQRCVAAAARMGRRAQGPTFDGMTEAVAASVLAMDDADDADWLVYFDGILEDAFGLPASVFVAATEG